MRNSRVSDNDIQQANRLIAFDVINERLGVDPTEENILFLVNCISDLEKSAESPCPRGETS